MREYEYISDTGLSVKFNNGSGYLLDATPLRSFDAEFAQLNNRISSFSTLTIQERDINISVFSKTEREAAEKADSLIRLLNSDVDKNTPGKLRINGYTMSCYIYGVASQAKFRNAKLLACRVVTDKWRWSREIQTFSFMNGSGAASGQDAYPRDYPYDFASAAEEQTISNPCAKPSEYRLTVFGPATTPSITVGGNVYTVDVTLSANEKLVVNSQTHAIYVEQADGTIVNHFADRDRQHDIWAQIPTGVSRISWNPNDVSSFYLTIIDERRLPPWND